MSKVKFKFKTGDTVKILAGKDKGKSGKVLQILPKQNAALVEGTNLMKKSLRPTQENPEGGITDLEAPIHVSNLALAAGE